MSNNDHWTLFFFLDRIVDQRDAYNKIKNNEEERKNSTYFGKEAVKSNVVYFILLAATVALAIGAYAFFKASGIWQGVLMVIVAIVILPFAVIYFIFALNCDIKQMVLNKKPIGWVSLMFTFLILAALIIGATVALLFI